MIITVPLLGVILGDNRLWLGGFSVREEEQVVGNVSFEEVCMKTRESVGIVQKFQSVFRVFRECVGNGVGLPCLSMNLATHVLPFHL